MVYDNFYWNQYRYRDDPEEYAKKYRNSMKDAIKNIVRKYDIKGGISTKALSKKLQIDIGNLRKYTKELQQEGVLSRKNKLSKWHSTEKSYQDHLLKSFEFSRMFGKNILYKDRFEYLITNDKKEEYLLESNCKDFTTYRFFYQPKFNGYPLERFLFELTNLIGGYLVYLIIYCMNPDNKIDKNTIIKMVEKSFINIIPYIFSTFQKNINEIKGENNLTFVFDEEKYFKNRVLYRTNPFTKEIIADLYSSFYNIYPLFFHQLQNIIDHLESELDGYKARIRHLEKESKKIESCKHEYEYHINFSSYNVLKQCRKCKVIKQLISKTRTTIKDLTKSLFGKDFKIVEIIKKNNERSVKVRILNTSNSQTKDYVFLKDDVEMIKKYTERLPNNNFINNEKISID